MNDDNHKTLQEFAMGEIIKELRAERDALKAELEKACRALESAGFTLKEGAQEWKPPLGPSVSPLLNEIDSLRAELEAARKQEPAVLIEGKKIFWNPEYKGVHEGGFYASPVPAQKECTFHGADAEACMDYSKEVPCEFTWEQEAKRAFWSGLEIGAAFGACAILPRWNEYIEKRKSELKGGENER